MKKTRTERLRKERRDRIDDIIVKIIGTVIVNLIMKVISLII